MVWMNSAMNQQSKQSLTVDPSFKVKDIKEKTRVCVLLATVCVSRSASGKSFPNTMTHFMLYSLCLRLQELFSACNPIVTKPKPKVEPPKEETPAEQNGPVNGQEKPQEETADKGAKENTGNPTSESTENKPDMDLD